MGTDYTSKNRTVEGVLRQERLFPSTSAPWQQKILDNLLAQLKFRDNSVCLDAACGIGNNIETLLKYFQRIIAFDKSSKAIEFTKKRHREQRLRSCLPLGLASRDLLYVHGGVGKRTYRPVSGDSVNSRQSPPER